MRARTRSLLALAALLYASSARGGINAWTSNGPAGSPVLALAIDPHTPRTLYAGTGACVSSSDGTFSCTGNLFKSTDGGTHWTASATGLPSFPVVSVLAIDPQTPTTLYAGTESPGGLFKSTDGGANWSPTGLGTPIALAIDPDTASTLYAGWAGAGVLKSTDGGSTWDAGGLFAGYTVVVALAIDPTMPCTLYAGSVYGGGYALKSTDGGSTWSPAATGLTTGVGAFAIDPATPTTLYAAGYNVAGVFKSTNGGALWGALDVEGRLLAIDPLRPSTLYAAGDGVFKSTNGGASWQTFNTGLPSRDVRALGIARGTLYAGTKDGVFAIEAATFSVESTEDAPDASPGDGVCATADGVCTLRAAVESARDGDLIVLPSGTYFLTLGALDINVGLTLRGSGVASTRVDGGEIDVAGGPVEISDVTIQNGGGIRNRGTLILSNSNVTDNVHYASAGGITNEGDATLTNVTISGNMTILEGGGIRNDGTLRISDSTVRGNSAVDSAGPAFGGGISNRGAATLTNVAISGNTADGRQSSGGHGGGIYNFPGGALTLSHVTLADNAANSPSVFNDVGGGISNDGALTLTNSTVSGNVAPGNGGGIFNSSSATLTNVTVSANLAIEQGGGIFNAGTGTLNLTNVTISTNDATMDSGGGIFSLGALTLTNVTISGNTTSEQGGGIFNTGDATLTNVTVSGNTAPGAAGIFHLSYGGVMQLRNTLVANNLCTDLDHPGGECQQENLLSLGHNLSSDGTCGFSGSGDVSNVDPRLGPLQDNGGPTFTQALLRGSPAIDAGSPDCPPPATDQRGVARTPPCDIGAYESGPVSCAGDCDEHGTVTVDELLTMVHIALGDETFTACEAGDANHDTHISIDEIVAAVNNALNGCPAS